MFSRWPGPEVRGTPWNSTWGDENYADSTYNIFFLWKEILSMYRIFPTPRELFNLLNKSCGDSLKISNFYSKDVGEKRYFSVNTCFQSTSILKFPLISAGYKISDDIMCLNSTYKYCWWIDVDNYIQGSTWKCWSSWNQCIELTCTAPWKVLGKENRKSSIFRNITSIDVLKKLG